MGIPHLRTAQSRDDQKAPLTEHAPRLMDVLVHHLAPTRDFEEHIQFAVESIAQCVEQRRCLSLRVKLAQ